MKGGAFALPPTGVFRAIFCWFRQVGRVSVASYQLCAVGFWLFQAGLHVGWQSVPAGWAQLCLSEYEDQR